METDMATLSFIGDFRKGVMALLIKTPSKEFNSRVSTCPPMAPTSIPNPRPLDAKQLSPISPLVVWLKVKGLRSRVS